MLKTKIFEIRDRMTFIPIVAVCTDPDQLDANEKECWLLLRGGCGPESLHIFRCDGHPLEAAFGRTVKEAAKHIRMNWDKLTSGDVIDIEFILGESPTQKVSEMVLR